VLVSDDSLAEKFMGITAVFGDAGTSVVGSFFKNRQLQWLPGWIFIAAIILRFPAQDPLFPHMKEARGLVEDIQSYIPFLIKYDVPIIDFLIVIFITTIFVLFFLQHLSPRNLYSPWAYSVKRCAEVSLGLMLPTCVAYASLLIFASVTEINQALAGGYHSIWFFYVLFYLCAFLSHVFNSFHSWFIDSNEAVIDSTAASVGVIAAVGNLAVDATDRGIANRYINKRSSTASQSMRDRFNADPSGEVGQVYVKALGSGQTEGSVDQWIDIAARSAAMQGWTKHQERKSRSRIKS
jgi:hypothetical protein